MSGRTFRVLLAAVYAGSLLGGCKDKPSAKLAPVASALQAAPAAPSSTRFKVDSSSSKVTFLMDSPLEKIDGDASGALEGELFVDVADLSRSTGLVRVDLQQLVLYQQKRTQGQPSYSERKKSDLQNEHAKNWLQIVPQEGEVSAEVAAANRFAEFKLERLERATLNDVAAASGASRTLTAVASGEFRLHGRKLPKSVSLELTFAYDGDHARSVHVKTTEPLAIGLAEFEVNPRDNAGKFVKSLTDALSSNLNGKVAQSAPLILDFSANTL